MQTFFISLLYIVAFANFFVVVLIFSRSVKDKINLSFGLMSAGVVLWCVAIANFYSQMEFINIVNWTKVAHLAGLFVSLMFLYFTLYFPDGYLRGKYIKNNLYLLLSPIVLFLFMVLMIFFSDKIIENIYAGGYELGSFYFTYSLFITINFGVGFFVLIYKFVRERRAIIKGQIKYILVGVFVSSSLATIFDLFLPVIGNYGYLWFGPVATVFLVGSSYLAVQKYHLFDIKVFVVEFLTILIGLVLLTRFLFVTNYIEYAVNGLILVGIVIFGYTIMKSVVRDIEMRTKIENLIAQLTVANNRLEQLDRQKTEFVSIASHQLRTPLTAIKGYASMLLEKSFGEISKKEQGHVEKIYKSSQKLVMVIENFLTISRLDQNRMIYRFEKINLVKIINAIVKELGLILKQKNINLKIVIPKKAFYVKGDEMKVKQIVYNLLTNSIKHAGSNKIFIELEKTDDKKVVLKIVSQKRELKKGEVKHLFDRKDNYIYDMEVQDDTGVELFLSREIVRSHNGLLDAHVDGLNNFIFSLVLISWEDK